MEIWLTSKKVKQFGKEVTLIMPMCEKSRTLCSLLGKKSLSPSEVGKIRTMGFVVVLHKMDGDNVVCRSVLSSFVGKRELQVCR